MTDIIVTVDQYQGPTMSFSSVEEYGKWMISEIRAKGDDACVDLHESWRSPEEESASEEVLIRMLTEAGVA